LTALGPPPGGGQPTASAAGVIDSVLMAGTKSGYVFFYTALNSDVNDHYQGYNLSVAPASRGLTGNAYYFTDQTI
jgi:hypothetical protein